MPSRILHGLILLILHLSISTSFSAVIYVKWDATGANNGTSWTDAFTDLQNAIGAATPTDDIWVATGTYKPTAGTDRTISFEIDDRNLYGGFAGAEASVNERNIEANPTVLSGDIGVPVDYSDNSYNVVRSVVFESTFLLDGFTIRDGNADDPTGSDRGGGGYFDEPMGAVYCNLIVEDNRALEYGGGIYVHLCRFDCTWENVLIRNNSSADNGGGLYHRRGQGNLDGHMLNNCVFENNTSSKYGGGADIRDMSLTDVVVRGNSSSYGGGGIRSGSTRLTCVTIINNQAYHGGGFDGSGELIDCEFRSNTATSYGGGLNGGPHVTDTDFIDNYATYNGGAVYSYGDFVSCTMDSNAAGSKGGAVYASSLTSSFTMCTMRYNTAESKGGAAYVAGEASFHQCEMSSNTSEKGAAICAGDSTAIATVTRGTISENTATIDGGAIHAEAKGEIIVGSSLIKNNHADMHGGGAADNGGMITLINSTLYGNSAGANGGGVAALGGGTINVSNSIVWNNTAPADSESYYLAGNLVCDHSDIKGSGGSGSWNTLYGTDGGANIDADPSFVNAPSGDFHISSASPCIEVGDKFNPYLPEEDLDGNPRIVGINPDMGCYESSSFCPGVTRLYVDASSPASGPGTSWEVAFHRLEEALGTAQTCPIVTEIWVAEGTYYPTTESDRSKSFALIDSITMYGGFAGFENSFSHRQLGDHPTILSGEIGSAGADDNSYHVITCGAVSSETIVDGFHITGGNADGAYPYDRGGGMYNFGGSPTIRNVIFSNNATINEGGGLYSITGTGVHLINVLFKDNSALQNGGALINSLNQAVLTNVTFCGNSSSFGPVIKNYSSNPIFTNCILWGNVSPLIENSNSYPTFSHCDVEGSGGSTAWDVSLGTDMGNNLDTDPLFVNISTGDLHLQEVSPVIDMGDNSAPHIASEDLDGHGRLINGTVDMGPYEFGSVTGIGNSAANLVFHGVYPNPCNPMLTIEYELDRSREVRVAVYNIRGELVRILQNRRQGPGLHQIRWDGTNKKGQRAASGIYLIVIQAEDWRMHRKAVLLK